MTNRQGLSAEPGQGAIPCATSASPVVPGMLKETKFVEASVALLEYCRRADWAGWDPYDALNSRLLGFSAVKYPKLVRLAMTQAFKRSPINARRLLGVPTSQNPKGLALFISAALRLEECGLGIGKGARTLAGSLLAARSEGQHACWGYNFPWQQRFLLVPAFSPNIICTSFGGEAMVDLYEATGEVQFLDAATSAARFILEGLPVIEDGDGKCFSYTPFGSSTVHNASLLGGALLARVYRHGPDCVFVENALAAAKYSVTRQRPDGSWPYGEAPTQQWVDGFHTGFNLLALRTIQEVAPQSWIRDSIERGFKYYLDRFFENGCVPKYYHDRLYPIDIHSVSQAVLTLVEFRRDYPDGLLLARRVLEWAFDNMRSPEGYFYYQKHRWYTNRIPYMRWSQAWMLRALAEFVAAEREVDGNTQGSSSEEKSGE